MSNDDTIITVIIFNNDFVIIFNNDVLNDVIIGNNGVKT